MANNEQKQFWAGGFLYNPNKNEVFLHKRDSKTNFNPNMWAFFGGLNELNETPIVCFIRELKEEIGLSISKSEAKPLCEYMNKELNTYRHVFFVETDVAKNQLKLGEGAGFDWIDVNDMDKYKLTDKTRDDLNFFKEYLYQRKG